MGISDEKEIVIDPHIKNGPYELIDDEYQQVHTDIPENNIEMQLFTENFDNGRMADDLIMFLHEVSDDLNYNDSHLLTMEGKKLGIYTPLIKARCPLLYYQYFSSPEGRANGLDMKTIELRPALKDKYLDRPPCFSTSVCKTWIENIYLGELINSFHDEKEAHLYYSLKVLYCQYPLVIEEADVMVDESDEDNKCYTITTLWNDEKTKDFEMSCFDRESNQKQTVRLHKYILASRSLYFRERFKTNPLETAYDASEIFDDVKSLENLVYYLYHNLAPFTAIENLNQSTLENPIII